MSEKWTLVIVCHRHGRYVVIADWHGAHFRTRNSSYQWLWDRLPASRIAFDCWFNDGQMEPAKKLAKWSRARLILLPYSHTHMLSSPPSFIDPGRSEGLGWGWGGECWYIRAPQNNRGLNRTFLWLLVIPEVRDSRRSDFSGRLDCQGGGVQTTVGAAACALLALGISTSLFCGLKQTYLGSEGDHYFLLMWKTRWRKLYSLGRGSHYG